MEPCLFCSSHWGETSPYPLLFNLCTVQAFLVVGGRDYLSSVLTLLPGATAWTPIPSLPRALSYARASIVGGRIRVNGGYGGGSRRSEVMIEK